MNYNDDYESVTTVAHEWGHAMHSFLANKAQPFVTSNYAISSPKSRRRSTRSFAAARAEDGESDDERVYYLGYALEQLRGTFFRQAMFAEFERNIHARVDKGEAADRRVALTKDLLRDPETLSRRPAKGRGRHRRRLLRRVGLHPALLQQFSMSISTRTSNRRQRAVRAACRRERTRSASALSGLCSRPAGSGYP
jgi:hypothetical protein